MAVAFLVVVALVVTVFVAVKAGGAANNVRATAADSEAFVLLGQVLLS